jgi:pimeloyl-ACP methyl ester carboxylesterase
MIQGVGIHGDGWGPQVQGLSAHYRCLTFDHRGMCLSQPLGAPLTVAQMAEDALALMDAQGWPSAHIVGHSLGGLVAQHLAVTERARVRSLSLLCTFSRGKDATRVTAWMAWVGLRTRAGTRRSRRNAFLRIVMPPSVTADSAASRNALAAQLAPIIGHDLADQPPVAMQQLAAMRAYDATPRLSELSGLPVLVISAEHDRIAPPAIGRALAAAIPDARFVMIPDAAHGVTIQRAEAVNQLLTACFERG